MNRPQPNQSNRTQNDDLASRGQGTNPNRQANGASLLTDKNQSKPHIEKVGESHQVWGDNLDADSFVSLLKILRHDTEGIKLQNVIMKTRPNTQTYLQLAVSKLCTDVESDRRFDAQLKQKPHLGLTMEELGFKKGAVMQQCQDLDLLWNKLIEIASIELSTNKLTAYRTLRRFVQQEAIFRQLYEPQIGGNILKPKNQQIKLFFKTDTNGAKVFDEQSLDFLVILSRLSQSFFQEANTCIYSIMEIFDEEVKYQGFKSLFDPDGDFSMLKVLWDTYCKLSHQILVPDKTRKITQKYERYSFLKKDLYGMKLKLLMNLIKLFYSFSRNFFDNEILLRLYSQDDFMTKLVKQLDGDIILFEKSESRGEKIDHFSRYIVELFLILFPFRQHRQKQDKIHKVTREIQSQSLKLVKILFSLPSSGRGRDPTVVIKQLEEIAKCGDWNAFSSKWKKWLGIFLFKYKEYLNKNAKELTKKIIYLCKNVVAEEYTKFWLEKTDIYLQQIKQFLKKIIGEDIQSTNFNDVSILPICTKLLGTLNERYSRQMVNLLTSQVVEGIFSSITQTLKLDITKNQRQKYDRIVYYSQDDKNNSDQILQQEVKFICRLIEIEADNLEEIENYLIYGRSQDRFNQGTGTILIVKFLQIFYSISPETVSGLKCLRYLIKAINALFICAKTRGLVCMALAVLECGKNSNPRGLKAIVSSCFDYDTNNEIGKQAEKLRMAISFHLNCIVKLSDSLEQYFPTTTQRQACQQYRKLHDLLTQQKIFEADQYIKELREKSVLGFKSVQWFYEFTKLFESNRLTSIDLDTIRLLLLKMRIKNEDSREYFNLSAIVDILNHSQLEITILQTLTPIVKRQKSKKERERYFFGLANKHFEGFIVQPLTQQYNKSWKYASKSYRFLKQKFRYNKQKHELYSRLSGCLSIIQTMLRLSLEGNFPLLKRLKAHNYIFEGLFSNKPYMFNVKFAYSFRKTKDQSNTLATLIGGQWYQRQISTSINLMHCITSYWDFQNRLNIDESEHPSNILKLVGHFTLDISQKIYNRDIIYFSQENVLTDINRKPQSIGVGTVCKILQYIVLLGGGKTLYFSILSRNYPICRGLATSSINFAMMQQFLEGVSYAASRRGASLREREYIMELYSVLIRQEHFGNYITTNIFRFKQAINRARQFSDISRSSRLVTQMLHFLNMLLCKDPNAQNIRFAKSCLTDPVQFGTKLLAHCQNRISLLTNAKQPQRTSKYATFSWALATREAAICKLALLLYLGLASYFITNEHQSLTLSLSNLILKNSSIFLKATQILLNEQYTKLVENLDLKESLKAPCFTTSNNASHFIVNDVFLNAILLNSPYSFIDNYLQQPWQVLQNSNPRQGKDLVLATYRYNAMSAFFYANEALIQFYYLLVNSIFKRGQSGIFFITQTQKQIEGKIPSIIMLKKQKAKNQISSLLILNQNESISNTCFRLSKDIEKQIWEGSKIDPQPPRDVGLVTVSEIMNFLQGKIEIQAHHLGECCRIVDKLVTYMKVSDHRFHFSVFINMIFSLQKLSQKILQISLTKKETASHYYQAYFQRIQQCLTSIQRNICLDSLTKLSEQHLSILILECLNLFQLQIENIQFIEKEKKDFDIKIYLQHEERFGILEKLKAIMNSLIPLLNLTQYSPSIITFILQLVSKVFMMDHLSKRSRIAGITRYIKKEFFSSIESICERITNQDEILCTFIMKFIQEISLYAQTQHNRQIMKILKLSFEKIIKRFDKIIEIKTIGEILKHSSILGAFASLGLQQNWKSQLLQTTLDQLFFIIQKKPLQFSCERIIPSNEFQAEMSNKYLNDIKRGKGTSIYSLYTQFSMYQLLNNYLLFVSFAIKYSPSLYELCNNTFNKGPLQDMSLDRLRESLINAFQFMNRFSAICFSSQIEDILKINSFTCVDEQFIRQMDLIPLCFQNYNDKADFYADIFNTLVLLYEAVNLLCRTWEKYDWKSIADWGPNRKDLMQQFQKLVILFKRLFKEYKEANYEKLLMAVGEQIRDDLQSYKY